ncbi:hypothetical protein G7Y89_g14887 [Cudoniella acicularis]|uniref:Enoyl reductase (ER) domain-containing protein n=1 Tax=Cudoniella acicularis TaxID=354080 RepID=A0A8H4VQJ6_9HELO|nr:hypothetical protein G7Y89_g14887 [Cudoniella acicularis]
MSVGPNSTWATNIGAAVVLVTNPDWIDGDDPAQYTVDGTLGAGKVHGTLTQYKVVKDTLVILAPKNLSFEEAASMVACGGTAMHALEGGLGRGSLQGKTVLAMGTGGLAAALGAHVIATSSSPTKLEVAKRLGATHLINYTTTPNWAEEVLRLTDGKGVDLVADVGGAGTLLQSLEAVRVGGTVSMIGFLTVSEKVDIVPGLVFGAKTLKGIRGNSKAMLERAIALIERNDLHPVISVYEWDEVKKAFGDLRRGNSVGKLVIKV